MLTHRLLCMGPGQNTLEYCQYSLSALFSSGWSQRSPSYYDIYYNEALKNSGCGPEHDATRAASGNATENPVYPEARLAAVRPRSHPRPGTLQEIVFSYW